MNLIRIASISMLFLCIFCSKSTKSIKDENPILPVKTELESIVDSLKLHDTCHLANPPVSIFPIDTNPSKDDSPVSNIFSDTLNISNLPDFADSIIDSVLPNPLTKLNIINCDGVGSVPIDEKNIFVDKKPVQEFIYYLVSKHGQIIPDPLKFDSISVVSNYTDRSEEAEYIPVWKVGFSSPISFELIDSLDRSILIIGSNQQLNNSFIRHHTIDDSLQELILKRVLTNISFQNYFSSIDFYYAGESDGKIRAFVVFNKINCHNGTYMYAVDIDNGKCSIIFHFAPFENSQYLGCFSLNKQPFADVFVVRIYEVVYALLERNDKWIEKQISNSGTDVP